MTCCSNRWSWDMPLWQSSLTKDTVSSDVYFIDLRPTITWCSVSTWTIFLSLSDSLLEETLGVDSSDSTSTTTAALTWTERDKGGGGNREHKESWIQTEMQCQMLEPIRTYVHIYSIWRRTAVYTAWLSSATWAPVIVVRANCVTENREQCAREAILAATGLILLCLRSSVCAIHVWVNLPWSVQPSIDIDADLWGFKGVVVLHLINILRLPCDDRRMSCKHNWGFSPQLIKLGRLLKPTEQNPWFSVYIT